MNEVNPTIRLWDYCSEAGRNEIEAWARSVRLGVRERAQLNQKMDMLERVGFEVACHMEFLAGTSGDFNHIYKLVVKSQRMLRPMLCRGPLDTRGEATVLCGAIEKDFKLDPPTAAGQAEKRRQRILDLPAGQKGRAPHERF